MSCRELVARVLAAEPAALVEAHFEVLMAAVYPHSVVGGAQGRALMKQKLAGPMMTKLLPRECARGRQLPA
jgi:hypothetical protein